MVGVGDKKSLLVKENRLGFLERYPVLARVLRVLALVPLEAEHAQPP
jgi:hypothetical protein